MNFKYALTAGAGAALMWLLLTDTLRVSVALGGA